MSAKQKLEGAKLIVEVQQGMDNNVINDLSDTENTNGDSLIKTEKRLHYNIFSNLGNYRNYSKYFYYIIVIIVFGSLIVNLIMDKYNHEHDLMKILLKHIGNMGNDNSQQYWDNVENILKDLLKILDINNVQKKGIQDLNYNNITM